MSSNQLLKYRYSETIISDIHRFIKGLTNNYVCSK